MLLDRKKTNLMFALMLVMSLFSCGGGGTGGGDDGGDDGGGGGGSHNAGLECLSCHDGSPGPLFTAAGTAYVNGGPQKNATVRFYAYGTNTLLDTVQTDDSGNFYTSSSSVADEFSVNGVEVEFTGPSGGTNRMNPAVSGACNASGCHDSGNRITARN
jgi:hypothetical protein